MALILTLPPTFAARKTAIALPRCNVRLFPEYGSWLAISPLSTAIISAGPEMSNVTSSVAVRKIHPLASVA